MHLPKKQTKHAKQKLRNGMMFWNIPPGLKRRFKSACASRGRTMKEVIVELLERFCESCEPCGK